jgi:hypothetical protein
VLSREAPAAGRAARDAARALTARIATILAAALLAAAGGCGDDEEGEPGDGAIPPGEGTELAVVLHPAGLDGPPPAVAEVSCPPDEPSETNACEAVDALPDDAVAPVPPGAVCTQIYGGPDLVEVEGTLHGEEVATELTRTNGCEIERFEGFLPLLQALFDGYRPGRAVAP